jgi:hypothetical protein
MNTIKNILEFAEAFGCVTHDTPTIPDGPGTNILLVSVAKLMMLRSLNREYSKEDVRCSRFALMIEEVAEFGQALAERDLVKCLDSIGDQDYINIGSTRTFGMHEVIEECCRRVHVSNMSKLDENGKANYDAAGKVVKGPNYKPVDLTDLVDGTWLASQSKPKTRFEQLLNDLGEVDVTVMASSKFPTEEDGVLTNVQASDWLDELDEKALSEIQSGNTYVPSNAKEVADRVTEQLEAVDGKVADQVDEAKAKASEWLKDVGTEK